MTLRRTIIPVLRHTQHYLAIDLSLFVPPSLSLSLSLSSVFLFSICVRFCVYLHGFIIFCMCAQTSSTLKSWTTTKRVRNTATNAQLGVLMCATSVRTAWTQPVWWTFVFVFLYMCFFFVLSLINFVLTAYYMHARSSSRKNKYHSKRNNMERLQEGTMEGFERPVALHIWSGLVKQFVYLFFIYAFPFN